MLSSFIFVSGYVLLMVFIAVRQRGALVVYNIKADVQKAHKNDAEYYYAMGDQCADRKDYFTAVEYYSKAISLKRVARYYNNRGCAYYHLQQYLKALEDFTAAIQLLPDVIIYYINRGWAYVSYDKLELACRDWRRAVKLGSEDAKELVKEYCPLPTQLYSKKDPVKINTVYKVKILTEPQRVRKEEKVLTNADR